MVTLGCRGRRKGAKRWFGSHRSWIGLELNLAGCNCGMVGGRVVLVEVSGRWRYQTGLVDDGKARLE